MTLDVWKLSKRLAPGRFRQRFSHTPSVSEVEVGVGVGCWDGICGRKVDLSAVDHPWIAHKTNWVAVTNAVLAAPSHNIDRFREILFDALHELGIVKGHISTTIRSVFSESEGFAGSYEIAIARYSSRADIGGVHIQPHDINICVSRIVEHGIEWRLLALWLMALGYRQIRQQ